MRSRGLARLVSVVMLGTMLSACSGEDDPLSRIHAYDPSRPGAPTASGGTQEPPPKPVARPWRAGMRQYGIAVYWERNTKDSDQTVRAKARRILDWVVSTGANSVSLSYPFTMSGITSSRINDDGPMTPTAGQIGIVLEEARARRLRAALRPILSEKNLTAKDPKAWRGTIAPADRDEWFASYAAMISKYAKPAQTFGAASIIVATELNSMERDRRWSRVTKAAAQVFRGELGYSANHDRLPGSMPISGVVKSVDAYPPVNLPDSATVAQLTAALDAWLEANTVGATPELVLAEVAIGARRGAYKKPFSTAPNGPLVPRIQQRWFDATCELMRRRDLGGIYYWMINFDADPRTVKPTAAAPMDFVGGESVGNVRACFARPAERKSGT
ncbi:hypothetical protein EV385_0167 [Krasilnikovia cinnamomea]|uniref:Glycosyl hydrolase family 18 (Putative chitinase) n=1 Tax=Krasilnikovia cinnamomea TaxID=349313 RepID=A0A4Q7ZCQ7_9ACTN|nr:hypothetical protein [Krasilnikovia cinnamomea]RZU48452.1 hypothetical protein EV385_0167 [Krasilnikovia cinnamomea]